jgi:starch-binding outer membrane protein, SusD/RagB family
MKNIIKTAIFFIAIVSSLLFTGCEDFLNKNLQKDLTQETFPVSESDALLATNAVYATLRNGNYHFGLFPLTDIMSDDALKGSNPGDQAAVIGPYDTYTFTPSGEELGRWWATLYEGIKRANVVLEKVPIITMDAALQSRYIGEASFLRALFYFDLVRAWGGVPIVTELSPPLTLPRSSKDEVYNLIVNDLEKAIENLPEKNEYDPIDFGRATKGAAKALLAKVYLFQHNYTEAENYLLDMILNNNNQYALEPVFTDACGEAGEYGDESVFEVGALGVEAEPGNQYANVQGVRGTPNRGWGFNRPSMDLRDNVFEDDDPRWSGTIIELGDIIDGIEIIGDGTTLDETLDDEGNVIEVECYNRKVWTNGNNVPTQFGHNRRILRYADVLLMAAEVLNENNNPGDALMYLNMVRARAREGNAAILPDITTTNQDELRDIILLERRRELALEGHRFWDLVRTGKAPEILGPLGFIQGKNELFPIPQTEIDISQGSLTQNPGW